MANKNTDDNKTADKLIADSVTDSHDFTRHIPPKREGTESKFKENPLSKNIDNKDFNATIDAIINGVPVVSSINMGSGKNKNFAEVVEDTADIIINPYQPTNKTVDVPDKNNESAELNTTAKNPEINPDSTTNTVDVKNSIPSEIETAATEVSNDAIPKNIIEELGAINDSLSKNGKKPSESIKNTRQDSQPAIVADDTLPLFPKADVTQIKETTVKEVADVKNTLGLASEIETQPTDNPIENKTTGLSGKQTLDDKTAQEHINDYPNENNVSDDPILGSYNDKYLNLPAESTSETSGIPWVLLIGILAIIWAAAWRFNFFGTENQNVIEDNFKVSESAIEKPNNTISADLNKNAIEISGPFNNSEIKNNSNEKQLRNAPTSNEVVSTPAQTTITTPIKNTNTNTNTNTAIKAEQHLLGQTDKTTPITNTIEKIAIKEVTIENNDSKETKVQKLAIDSPVEAIKAFLKSDDKTQSKGFILYGLNFNTASSQISKSSAKVIADLAVMMSAYPALNIRLEGHTDNQGNAEKNKLLSFFRAKSVKTRLVSLNINPKQIATEGLGEEFPITTNDTKAGRLKNRRVEIIITAQ